MEIPTDILNTVRDRLNHFKAVTRMEVEYATLYGSRARGIAGPDSDWDISFVFKVPSGRLRNIQQFQVFKDVSNGNTFEYRGVENTQFYEKLNQMDMHHHIMLMGIPIIANARYERYLNKMMFGLPSVIETIGVGFIYMGIGTFKSSRDRLENLSRDSEYFANKAKLMLQILYFIVVGRYYHTGGRNITITLGELTKELNDAELTRMYETLMKMRYGDLEAPIKFPDLDQVFHTYIKNISSVFQHTLMDYARDKRRGFRNILTGENNVLGVGLYHADDTVEEWLALNGPTISTQLVELCFLKD